MLTPTKERAPARAPLPQCCHAGKREHAETSPAQRRLQHLTAARQHGDEARLRLYLMVEQLHAAGVDVDDATFLEDVKEIIRDLNRLIAAGGKVELLREAFPAWASAIMPRIRDEIAGGRR